VFTHDHQVVDIGGTLRRLRAEKDTIERDRLRRAAEIAVEAAIAARSRIGAGVGEQEVAAAIAERIWLRGARATHIVVGSGPRSVVLHAEPTARVPHEGDLVVIDIGVLFEGYWAEIARTMVVGQPSNEQEAWHRVVLSAQAAAAAKLEPGRPAADVDAAARDAITRAGYDGSRFNHAAGHGLGLLGMDLPAIAPDSTDHLPTSCALTLEPGLYFTGHGGVRIEDTYLLDRGQVEELTGSVPKGLR
jgi:Xaa-Pro dipeptidase